MKNLRVFLPQIATYQLEDIGLLSADDSLMEVAKLSQDWQSSFCEFVGMNASDLPWTQLRLAQFNIDGAVKTACCCDPVLMQLTHRGAYMLGQAPLSLSQNDAIRIVAQINERLMRDGEQLYLVDNHSWLYTSENGVSLSSLAIKDLIGKDVFNYPYAGEDSDYWQQLAMEIQMLLKEMVDYQGLPAADPETLLNVHFSGLINVEEIEEIPFVKNESLSILSDNELIKAFCLNSLLSHQSTTDLELINNSDAVVIAFDSERESYAGIIDFWNSLAKDNTLESATLFCQDSQIFFKPKASFLSRFFNKANA